MVTLVHISHVILPTAYRSLVTECWKREAKDIDKPHKALTCHSAQSLVLRVTKGNQ